MTPDLPLYQHGHGVPLVVNAGIGVNSTALLVELSRRGERPDLVIFADVGDEKPSTYAYVAHLDEWLASVGFPPVTTVRYEVSDFKNWPPYHGIGENCLTNGTLPGIAFGPKSCSIKWKRTPIEKHCRQVPAIASTIAAGRRFHQYIGYDAGPPDRRRRAKADTITDKLAEQSYPLQSWGWDRARCAKEIAKAGLIVPDKSSCTFCSAMKPHEVDTLPIAELRKIVAIESRYIPRRDRRAIEAAAQHQAALDRWELADCRGPRPKLPRTVDGLWISRVKGHRGATPRPGSMTEYISATGLLTAAEIDFILGSVPTEIIRWQDAHKAGRIINEWPAFFAWLNHECDTLRSASLAKVKPLDLIAA